MINVVANRYAEALFQVGEEVNSSDNLYKELSDVVDVLKSNVDFYSVLKSPLVSKTDKKSLVEKVFTKQISASVNNFLKIIIDKDRILAIEEVQKAYKELLNEKNNIIEGTVITAVDMSDSEIKQLENKLSSKYNKNVTLKNEIDQSILGGVLVRIGNEEIDGTVKSRLTKMKDQLSQVIS